MWVCVCPKDRTWQGDFNKEAFITSCQWSCVSPQRGFRIRPAWPLKLKQPQAESHTCRGRISSHRLNLERKEEPESSFSGVDSQQDDLGVDVWSEGERRREGLVLARVRRGGLAILGQLLRPRGESLDVHKLGASTQRIHPLRHRRRSLDEEAKGDKMGFNTAAGAPKLDV